MTKALSPPAISHGSVLYVSYLGTYLLNDWLAWGTAPLLVFTVIFVVGYLAIWAVICAVIRRNAKKLNQMLEQQQKKHKGAVK